LKVEKLRVQDILRVDLPVLRADDIGGRLKFLEDRLDSVQLGFADQIDLVHDDDVAELDLLNQKLHNIVLIQFFGKKQRRPAQKFRLQPAGIDDRRDGVEPAQLRQPAVPDAAVHQGEGLRDRKRLADPAGLDQNIIVAVRFHKLGDLPDQVGAQGAADASVGKGNQAVVALRNPVPLLNQGSVDVHFPHIVDDDGRLHAFLVVQHMVDHSGLSGAEISG
jgi:hypothetical protein